MDVLIQYNSSCVLTDFTVVPILLLLLIFAALFLLKNVNAIGICRFCLFRSQHSEWYTIHAIQQK